MCALTAQPARPGITPTSSGPVPAASLSSSASTSCLSTQKARADALLPSMRSAASAVAAHLAACTRLCCSSQTRSALKSGDDSSSAAHTRATVATWLLLSLPVCTAARNASIIPVTIIVAQARPRTALLGHDVWSSELSCECMVLSTVLKLAAVIWPAACRHHSA